jgi:hypothetical protein
MGEALRRALRTNKPSPSPIQKQEKESRWMFLSEDLKQFAKSTLANDASPADKAAAKEAIRRLDAQKANRVEITESCGKKPSRKSFAADADGERLYRLAMSVYWDLLDARAVRKQAEKVLNGRDSTPLERRNARARLEALDGPPQQPEDEPNEKNASSVAPRREDFGFQSGHDWPEFVASRKEAQFQTALETWRKTAPPPSDPKVAAFLNGLDDESVKVTTPAPQPVIPKTPIAPPIDPSLFCEQCRVPFKVCGCNTVTCNLCLRSKSSCFPPCPNSKRR